MPQGYDPYRNKLVTLARTTGRIVVDLLKAQGQRIPRFDSNIYSEPTPPIIDGDEGGCCCDRTVYVSQDGSGEFTAIQDAIDWITDGFTPSITEPWVVYICPGDYDETLLGAPYVSLLGIGTERDGARIACGGPGPAITMPADYCSLENLWISLDIGLVNNNTPVIDMTAGGSYNLNNCRVSAIADSAGGALILLSDSVTKIRNCHLIYDNPTDVAGVQQHYGVNITGAASLEVLDSHMTFTSDDADDTIVIINEAAWVQIDVHVKNCIIGIRNINTPQGGLYDIYLASGQGPNKFWQHNHISIERVTPSAGTAYCYRLPSGAGTVVKSLANRIQGITEAIGWAFVALGDTIHSHFDEIENAPDEVLFGTVYRDHSDAPGEHWISGHIDIDDPPGARAFLDANQMIVPAAPPAQVLFNGQTYDTPSDIFNPATGDFTIPIDGRYLIQVTLQFDMLIPANSVLSIVYELRVNGVAIDYKQYDFANSSFMDLAIVHAVEPHDLPWLLLTDVVNVWVSMNPILGGLFISGDVDGTWSHMEVHKMS